MEWLDYADCAGDDPLKWDLDHVEADDVQEYARSVCGDCPVRRECAAHAIEDRSEVGRIFEEVSIAANLDDLDREPISEVSVASIGQVGVIRGGVALTGDHQKLLHEAAGLEWDGLRECSGCGRGLWSGSTPKEKRPEGSVRYASYGKCASCAYGNGRASRAYGNLGRGRPDEAVALRARGMKTRDIAELMGIKQRTVQEYLRKARDGA